MGRKWEEKEGTSRWRKQCEHWPSGFWMCLEQVRVDGGVGGAVRKGSTKLGLEKGYTTLLNSWAGFTFGLRPWADFASYQPLEGGTMPACLVAYFQRGVGCGMKNRQPLL